MTLFTTLRCPGESPSRMPPMTPSAIPAHKKPTIGGHRYKRGPAETCSRERIIPLAALPSSFERYPVSGCIIYTRVRYPLFSISPVISACRKKNAAKLYRGFLVHRPEGILAVRFRGAATRAIHRGSGVWALRWNYLSRRGYFSWLPCWPRMV